ncbi:MAG: aminodeoxychorismate/anthranilate synthase component II [Phycisphaerales bacterium]|nr:aminodeoxychorismate/anthranilate synthase component II [Phycisphaerales bacterium]
MLLIIDNYDSFTYNLVQRLGELDQGLEIVVYRNDKISVAQAKDLQPTHLVISPGPCTPADTGVCPQMIAEFRGKIPILGVCLGHQTIAAEHGMRVDRHDVLMHGKTSLVHHDGKGLYRGLSNPFEATRYHSLIVDPQTLTGPFERSAWTETGEIMGLRWTGSGHELAPMDGVQFHPESFLTVEGPQLLGNFIGMTESVEPSSDRKMSPPAT